MFVCGLLDVEVIVQGLLQVQCITYRHMSLCVNLKGKPLTTKKGLFSAVV